MDIARCWRCGPGGSRESSAFAGWLFTFREPLALTSDGDFRSRIVDVASSDARTFGSMGTVLLRFDNESQTRIMTDRFGMMLSVLCMVHCAAMPFVLAWLPMLGASWLADETAHRWLAGGAMLLGAMAFWPGYRMHRKWGVLLLGLLGLSLITHAAFAHEDDCCRPFLSRIALASGSAGQSDSDSPGHSERDASAFRQTGEVPVPNAVDPSKPKSCQACCQKNAECDAEGPEAEALKVNSASSTTASTWSTWQTPLGGLLLVVAHVVNLRAKKICCANCLGADSPQLA